jgi:hemerythrin
MRSEVSSLRVRSLGEARFDAEHEQFVALINRLEEAHDSSIAHALAELHAHAESHFGAEDIELRRLGGSANQCHLDEHRSVLASMSEVAELVDGGNILIARTLARELAFWLPQHVEALDLRLTQALFLQRTGGAQVQLRRPLQSVNAG